MPPIFEFLKLNFSLFFARMRRLTKPHLSIFMTLGTTRRVSLYNNFMALFTSFGSVYKLQNIFHEENYYVCNLPLLLLLAQRKYFEIEEMICQCGSGNMVFHFITPSYLRYSANIITVLLLRYIDFRSSKELQTFFFSNYSHRTEIHYSCAKLLQTVH